MDFPEKVGQVPKIKIDLTHRISADALTHFYQIFEYLHGVVGKISHPKNTNIGSVSGVVHPTDPFFDLEPCPAVDVRDRGIPQVGSIKMQRWGLEFPVKDAGAAGEASDEDTDANAGGTIQEPVDEPKGPEVVAEEDVHTLVGEQNSARVEGESGSGDLGEAGTRDTEAAKGNGDGTVAENRGEGGGEGSLAR